jgi:hypothetical protein
MNGTRGKKKLFTRQHQHKAAGTSSPAFLKAQWSGMAAIDFTTVEVWTEGGIVTHYVCFVVELVLSCAD